MKTEIKRRHEIKQKNLKAYEEKVRRAAEQRTAAVNIAEQAYQKEITRQRSLDRKAMGEG